MTERETPAKSAPRRRPPAKMQHRLYVDLTTRGRVWLEARAIPLPDPWAPEDIPRLIEQHYPGGREYFLWHTRQNVAVWHAAGLGRPHPRKKRKDAYMQAHIEDLEGAIQREEPMLFVYSGRVRTFSPWEIKGDSALGWDHAHEEPRRYRFDRIETDVLPVNGEAYVRPA